MVQHLSFALTALHEFLGCVNPGPRGPGFNMVGFQLWTGPGLNVWGVEASGLVENGSRGSAFAQGYGGPAARPSVVGRRGRLGGYSLVTILCVLSSGLAIDLLKRCQSKVLAFLMEREAAAGLGSCGLNIRSIRKSLLPKVGCLLK